jgi:hypothetical protein
MRATPPVAVDSAEPNKSRIGVIHLTRKHFPLLNHGVRVRQNNRVGMTGQTEAMAWFRRRVSLPYNCRPSLSRFLCLRAAVCGPVRPICAHFRDDVKPFQRARGQWRRIARTKAGQGQEKLIRASKPFSNPVRCPSAIVPRDNCRGRSRPQGELAWRRVRPLRRVDSARFDLRNRHARTPTEPQPGRPTLACTLEEILVLLHYIAQRHTIEDIGNDSDIL